jgi:hypothetical protein
MPNVDTIPKSPWKEFRKPPKSSAWKAGASTKIQAERLTVQLQRVTTTLNCLLLGMGS